MDYKFVVKMGGEGSGHWGHEGRPGEVGGSGEGGLTLTPRAEKAIGQLKGKYGYEQVQKNIWKVKIKDETKYTTDPPELAWSMGEISTFPSVKDAEKNIEIEKRRREEGVRGI